MRFTFAILSVNVENTTSLRVPVEESSTAHGGDAQLECEKRFPNPTVSVKNCEIPASDDAIH